MVVDSTPYDLKNGIRLTVLNPSGRIGLRDVADFLGGALRHFKHHRDDLKTGDYTLGPYTRSVGGGRRALGEIRLEAAGVLTAAQWAESVIGGYVNANTLEQIAEQLPQYKAAAQKAGGWLLEVVELLGRRGGDLQALQVKLTKGSV